MSLPVRNQPTPVDHHVVVVVVVFLSYEFSTADSFPASPLRTDLRDVRVTGPVSTDAPPWHGVVVYPPSFSLPLLGGLFCHAFATRGSWRSSSGFPEAGVSLYLFG